MPRTRSVRLPPAGAWLAAVAASALVVSLLASPSQAALPPSSHLGRPAPSAPARPSPSGGTGPCGTVAYDPLDPPTYDHVVVVMEENVSYAQLKTASAPYLKSLAAACGSELDMHAATHPSQPNYMAATSGVASGVGVHTSHDNVFAQLQRAGRTWALYAESMPMPCSASAGPTHAYKVGHNPAYFYTDLRTPVNTCAQDDVALSPGFDDALAADDLPAYSWVVPNLCDDMHWTSACPYPQGQRVRKGDDWLSDLLPRIFATPSYAAGRTLVVVTFDEGGDGGAKGADCTNPAYYPAHPDCQIPTVLASASIVPGSVDRSDRNLYGLLGTTEDLLGLPRLGRAVGQPSLRSGLGF